MDPGGPFGDMGKYGWGPADQETLTFAAMAGPGGALTLALLSYVRG